MQQRPPTHAEFDLQVSEVVQHSPTTPSCSGAEASGGGLEVQQGGVALASTAPESVPAAASVADASGLDVVSVLPQAQAPKTRNARWITLERIGTR